jgi:tRNA-splicing ligase RtcB
MKTELRGKDLIDLGYKPGPAISLALEAMTKMKHSSNEEKLAMAEDVLVNPDTHRETEYWNRVVDKIYPPKSPFAMRDVAVPVEIYGLGLIEIGAFNQIYQAAKLPVSYKAALMPDAHSGYGLPIGGVLATENAIIPYGVGVDIGCRMALSIFPMRDLEVRGVRSHLATAITKHTVFGAGGELPKSADHSVMDSDTFNINATMRSLRDRAGKQLGTSGSGNHFVEFGIVEFGQDDLLPAGQYLGLLSHSGSRGMGANIARHYTDKARKLRKLDPTVANLAWLMMNEEEGMEYWAAMNLAGDYAKANHDIIHQSISKYINERPLLKIENHHNFAWKEKHDGKEVIVHRKGATPAGQGVLGIIPGSMATDGYVVRGRGEAASLESASHGAGRAMSRTAAKQQFVWGQEKQTLTERNVHLIGGGVDECYKAYKDIESVMAAQTSLVDVVAKFTPKIVRMAGADEEPEE